MTDERLDEIGRRIFDSEPAGSPPPPRWCAVELYREVRRLRKERESVIQSMVQAARVIDEAECALHGGEPA